MTDADLVAAFDRLMSSLRNGLLTALAAASLVALGLGFLAVVALPPLLFGPLGWFVLPVMMLLGWGPRARTIIRPHVALYNFAARHLGA